jgi:uncharacterized membrane protein YbhN (UPF0104 family)
MSPRTRIRRRPPGLLTDRPEAVLATLEGPTLPVRTWIVTAFLMAALCAVAAGAHLADLDDAGAWEKLGGLSRDAGRIQWSFVPLAAAQTALHYLASALGVRAAADGVGDRRLNLGEVVLSQFAGAAANRLTPSGLGSAAITCRYLTRRGLPACQATAAIAAAGGARAVTKLGLLVAAVGVWSRFGGADAPAVRLDHLLARHSHLAVPVAAGAGGGAVVLGAILSWRRGGLIGRVRAAVAGVAGSLRHLLGRPGPLATTLAASAGAQVALALAFAVSVMAVPGTGGGAFGPLLAIYLVGATAGGAVPTPAGVGPTEAALIATLAVVHVPAGPAAQGVLLFRIVTFWAPALVGVFGTRRLRRAEGL